MSTLSKNAKAHLLVMMADSSGSYLKEIISKIETAGVVSDGAKHRLIDAMGDTRAAKEMVALMAVHGPMTARTFSWLLDSLTSKRAALEIQSILAS